MSNKTIVIVVVLAVVFYFWMKSGYKNPLTK